MAGARATVSVRVIDAGARLTSGPVKCMFRGAEGRVRVRWFLVTLGRGVGLGFGLGEVHVC